MAEALKALGAEICFVVRRHDAVAEHVLGTAGYLLFWLPEPENARIVEADPVAHSLWAGVPWQRDAAETHAALAAYAPDWIVVDHYAFDGRWHRAVRSALGCAILAIDDLGDRSLDVEVLVDANAAEDHRAKFAGRLSPGTRALFGPRFALLSSAYRDAPRYVFSPAVRSIGVFMGGTDAEAISAKVIDALRGEVGFGGEIEVVSTSVSAGLDALVRIGGADGKLTLSVDLPDLSAFYARHDLQIGAGGTSSYERCCIGAPTVAIVVAQNQLAVVPVLEQFGIARGAILPGLEASALLPDGNRFGAVVRELLDAPEARRTLSENSQRYVDGRGAERVALAILADRLVLRVATMADAALLHAWRNHPATRAVSINTDEIGLDDHLRWFEASLNSATRDLFVATIGGRPVGTIRFDLLDDGAREVSLYMDPGLPGLGLGMRMLNAGERAIWQSAGPCGIRAQVRPENRASVKLFQNAGYARTGDCFVKAAPQGEGIA